METLYQTVRSASDRANAYELRVKRRVLYSVFASLMSEAGELGEEIAIENGHSYKSKGADGVVGEAIDVIITALDLITVANPELTEEQITEMARRKCDKWISKIA